MADLLLDSDNDIAIINGDIALVETKEQLTLQRLRNKLGAFTNTLWTNVNYGINRNLVWKRATQTELDMHIADLVYNTEGVIKIKRLSSNVDPRTRVYAVSILCETETGDVELNNVNMSLGV